MNTLNDQERLRIEKKAVDKVWGKGNIADVGKRFKTALEMALEEAYAAANLPIPEAPKPELRWTTTPGRTMTWGTNGFGSVGVEVQKYTLGQVTEHGINSYAKLNVTGRPEWLRFRIMHKLGNGTRLLIHRQGKIEGDVTDKEPPMFLVKVEWNGVIPRTSWPGNDNDNIDLVLLDSEGCFVQLQVAVTTRRGKFWLSFQEVYAGQVARTTRAKAGQLGVETREAGGHIGVVAPLYDENAHGGDFLATIGMAHGVVPYALERGLSRAFTQCKVARWCPNTPTVPVSAMENGWEVAEVLWFNLAAGVGRLLCEDEKECYVHFTSVIDENGTPLASKGQFPVLDPMTYVLVRYDEGERGRATTAVRRLV